MKIGGRVVNRIKARKLENGMSACCTKAGNIAEIAVVNLKELA